MPARAKFQQIEQAEGKPIDRVLRELFARYGSQLAVARSLGVSQSTVSTWLLRFGLHKKTLLTSQRRSTSLPREFATSLIQPSGHSTHEDVFSESDSVCEHQQYSPSC